MVDRWLGYRRHSKGYLKDDPAILHPRIIFGAGAFLTPEFVKELKITHVINCAYENDSPKWFREKYPDRYHCIGADDTLTSNILDWYPEFKYVMKMFLSAPESERIYVHCQCGINRSGFLTLLFLCLEFSYNLENAIRVTLRQRPCALTNPAYMKQTVDYIKKHT